MSVSRLSSRYAKSLIELAEEKGAFNEVSADMKSLQKIVAENKELQNFFSSPVIKPEKKSKVASAMFEGKVHPITWSFMDLVIKKRREAYMKDIMNSYVLQYNVKNKIATATLITAAPVGDDIRKKIEGIVLKNLEGVESVEITSEIDKSLLGGFVLKYEDKLYDSSVKNKLEKLRKQFS